MQESPDRWLTRLKRAVRPHGRFAVISSSATAGALLILGGVVFANQSDNSTDVSSPTKSAVSSRVNADGSPAAGSSTSVTTTTAPAEGGSTTVPETGAQSTITTNTTTPGTPTTQSPVVTPTTLPTTTSPTTVLGATTTTTSRVRPQNGSLLPTLLTDPVSSTDDPNLTLKLSAGDKDGYITRIVINWGDQSDWTVIDYPLSSCIEPLNSLVSPSAMHSYTTANSYTVSVTVTSVNCVGDGQQQALTTTRVSVGGTENPPTTTTTTTTP